MVVKSVSLIKTDTDFLFFRSWLEYWNIKAYLTAEVWCRSTMTEFVGRVKVWAGGGTPPPSPKPNSTRRFLDKTLELGCPEMKKSISNDI